MSIPIIGEESAPSLVDRLKGSLAKEGIPYETDDNGNVVASKAVTSFLEGKGALHDPDNPVVVSPGEQQEEPLYTYEEGPEEPTKETQVGEVGDSPIAAMEKSYPPVEETYTGEIPELLGKKALVIRNPELEGIVLAAQFNDTTPVLNGKALGFGWHDFPFDAFTDSRKEDQPKMGLSDAVRAIRAFGLPAPRLTQDGELPTPKQKRRGNAGAFGKSTPSPNKVYLLAVETDAETRGVAISAPSLNKAKKVAKEKMALDFPDETVVSITKTSDE